MVQSQVIIPQQVYIEYETSNKSFIDMHWYLKSTGIKNNNFFLILYDAGLAGVDPRDPSLSPIMKQRVLRECICNYWYFLRTVVRIPMQGAGGSGSKYLLNRGNLAMNFLFILNYNQYVLLPRQHGKTTGALCRYLWCYNFGTTNSQIMFIHKDHNGSKANLKSLKEIRDMLPDYLQMSSATTTDGKKLKVPNTVVTMQHPLNQNKIVTFPSARSEDMADKLGRGATMPLQYYDEFAFMPYNKTAYGSAIPAYSKAAQNAKMNGAPYGVLITTTPGDLATEEGEYAFQLRNFATPWSERYYDLTFEELEELHESNTNSSFFLVEYTYQQLGSGEEYFKRMVIDLNRDWPKIRREVLLEWSQMANNCPFTQEELDRVKELVRPPIRTLFFGKHMQYQFLVYEDIDLRYPPIVGVDVAGAVYSDSSAITIIDSRTTKVCATLNCNYIPSDDLADVIYTLCTRYMSNCVICIERNGGFGVSVLQRLCKTSIKKNLYFEIKDKVIEEAFNGVRVAKKTARVKIYGMDSSKEIRNRLIELLYDRVAYHKDKIIAECIYRELQTLEVKKNGKVEHADTAHDDQIFSWLWALYVWYDGKDLSQFGLKKFQLKTDDEEEIVESELDKEESLSTVDVESMQETEPNEEQEKINKFIADASKYKLRIQFDKEQYEKEQDDFNVLLATNKAAKYAYEEKYHIEHEADSINGSYTIRLPDIIFSNLSEEDEEMLREKELHGNLYDQFTRL